MDRILSTYERDPSAREDMHQDLALAVWRALPSFRGAASHRTFIARIGLHGEALAGIAPTASPVRRQFRRSHAAMASDGHQNGSHSRKMRIQ